MMGDAARLALLGSGTLVAGQVAGRAIRDAFFLTSFSPALLPWAMIGASLFSIGVAAALAGQLSRKRPDQVTPVAFAANAVLFRAEWAALERFPAAVAVAIYLQVSAALPVLGSAFWSVINERFDPFRAKQIVPRMAAAGALAGVVGGVAAERIAASFGADWTLPMLAVLSAGCALTVVRIGPGEGHADAPPVAAKGPEPSPVSQLRERPLLREMAILVVLGAIAENLVEYVLMAEASRSIPDEARLVRFFSAFYVGCGVLTFLVQAALGRFVLRVGGLAGAIASLPAAVAAAGSVSLAFPGLASAVLVRGTETVVWNSTYQSGFELLFTPLPPAVKRRMKAWIDVSVRAVGSVAGAGLVLGSIAWLSDSAATISTTLAVGACALSLVGVLRLHRAYVSELEGSLKSGLLELREDDVLDATTAHTIANARHGVDRLDLLAQIEQTRQRLGIGEANAENTAAEPGRANQDAQTTSEGFAPGTEAAATPEAPASPLYSEDFTLRLQDLASGVPARVRRALHARRPREGLAGGSRVAIEDRLIAAHAIPLLARPELAQDARDFLRRVGPRCVGVLVDGLLDRAESEEIRIALTGLLSSLDDRRALDGLWRAGEEAPTAVRAAAIEAAARSTDRSGHRLPRDVVHARLDQEVRAGDAIWTATGPEIELACLLLALLHGRSTMSSILEGVRSDREALRGTAYEFFESVLPPSLSAALLRRLGIRRSGAS